MEYIQGDNNASYDNLRYTKMSLNNGSGAIPALGFGTLIPDPVAHNKGLGANWKTRRAFWADRAAAQSGTRQ